MLKDKIRVGTVLIIIIGIVSFFGDFTYEGARSIIPQYFTSLGGSVFLLGVVLGISEFAGYVIRLFSGRLADKTRSYWAMMFVGYAINLFAVPMLAFAGNYLMAALLIFLERFGRGFRVPPRDYIISSAAEEGKMGKAFAIEEGLDQAGAIVGPLVASLILYYKGAYTAAFAFFAVPAVMAMVVLFDAYRYHGKIKLEKKKEVKSKLMSSRKFLLYSIAIAISAAGLYQAGFLLYGGQSKITTYLVPLIFLVAMAGEGFFGFVFGLLYDKFGRNLVYLGLLLSIFIPLALMNEGSVFFFIAALIFGAVTGIQDTVMRAVVGSMIAKKKRGSAFGIFNAFYGFGFMISGIVVGYLYSSLSTIVLYVIGIQALALVVLWFSFREG